MKQIAAKLELENTVGGACCCLHVLFTLFTSNFPLQDYKKTLKVTWLAEAAAAKQIPIVVATYDHIISKVGGVPEGYGSQQRGLR